MLTGGRAPWKGVLPELEWLSAIFSCGAGLGIKPIQTLWLYMAAELSQALELAAAVWELSSSSSDVGSMHKMPRTYLIMC